MSQKKPPATTTAVATTGHNRSVLANIAARYSIEPKTLLDTLKNTAFKGATDAQMVALCVVADQYKLNPFLKEIYAFPDSKSGGIVPVVGIDGWLRIVNDHPQFDGMDVECDADSCTVTIHRKDRSHPTEMTEYMEEVRRDTKPWQTHPRRMLRHKTIIQCARAAFGFTGIKDPDEAERIVELERSPVAMPRVIEVSAEQEPAPQPQDGEQESLRLDPGDPVNA